MSGLAVGRRRAALREPAHGVRRDGCAAGAAGGRSRGADEACAPDHADGMTLDELLSGVWEALSGHESAACPLCGGVMRPRFGTGPVVTGGACTSCRTSLR